MSRILPASITTAAVVFFAILIGLHALAWVVM